MKTYLRDGIGQQQTEKQSPNHSME